MSQQDAVQVSQTRVGEILQGKASSTIMALMVEASQLAAVVEQLSNALKAEQLEHRETKLKLGEAMNDSPRPPAPPQT